MFKNILLWLFSVVAIILLAPFAIIRNVVVYMWNREWDELSHYFFVMAHGNDVAASSMIFRTTYKTISGVVGKKAFEEEQDGETNSYIYPFRDLIDWLFSHDPDHCYVTYLYEFEGEQKNIGG